MVERVSPVVATLPGIRPVVDFGEVLSTVVLSSQVLLSALSSHPSGQAQEVEGPDRRSLREGELLSDDLWLCHLGAGRQRWEHGEERQRSG